MARNKVSLGNVGLVTDVHTAARNPVYLRAQDEVGNEYIYLKGAANVAIGSWVNIDTDVDGTVVLLDTDTAASQVGRIAIAMAATIASTFGWYQIYGAASGLALTGSTDTKNAFATSTGGSVDDSGAGNEVLVYGAFSTGAVDESTFLQAFVINYPFITGLTGD